MSEEYPMRKSPWTRGPAAPLIALAVLALGCQGPNQATTPPQVPPASQPQVFTNVNEGIQQAASSLNRAATAAKVGNHAEVLTLLREARASLIMPAGRMITGQKSAIEGLRQQLDHAILSIEEAPVNRTEVVNITVHQLQSALQHVQQQF